jgi:hypothetical protein
MLRQTTARLAVLALLSVGAPALAQPRSHRVRIPSAAVVANKLTKHPRTKSFGPWQESDVIEMGPTGEFTAKNAGITGIAGVDSPGGALVLGRIGKSGRLEQLRVISARHGELPAK